MRTPLRETAFLISSGPESSIRYACRAGLSIDCAMPVTTAQANTTMTVTCPVRVSSPSVSAETAIVDWVASISERFGSRSASSPPHGASSSVGRNCAALSRPSQVPEWVS